MKTFSTTVDYSLDPFMSDEQSASLLEESFVKMMDELDEDERKKKERAAAQARAAARLQSMPAESVSRNGSWSDEDTAVASGISLMPGSETYETYIREREGMDSFELERADLAEIGFGTKGDLEAPGADEFHEEYSKKLATQDNRRIEQEYTADGRRYVGRDRIRDRRMIKASEADDIAYMARTMSGGTANELDDAFAEDVPEILDELVYDDGVSSMQAAARETEQVMYRMSKYT